MDNVIVRFYNQHKRLIWLIAFIIIFTVLLIQALNNYAEQDKGVNNRISYKQNESNYSVVTQKQINETISNDSAELLEAFFRFCNNQQTKEAYNLLSTDCKQELYPTIDDFIKEYYNKIFGKKRSYDYILWIATSKSNTYRVEIMEDILATGKKEEMPIQEYYTVVNDNGQYRLNIANYIGKEFINIAKNNDDININILSKRIFIDYEIYEIEVKNNTESTVIFNTKDNSKSIYIEDENKLKYIAFLNEISDIELELPKGRSKSLQIKFNRGFRPETDIKKVIFNDIKIRDEILNIEIEL